MQNDELSMFSGIKSSLNMNCQLLPLMIVLKKNKSSLNKSVLYLISPTLYVVERFGNSQSCSLKTFLSESNANEIYQERLHSDFPIDKKFRSSQTAES